MHQPGLTRSASRREYLLHTPQTFVRTTLPGLTGGMAVVHIAPQTGAAFAMLTAEMDAGGRLEQGPAQRFVYVLEGEVGLAETGSRRQKLIRSGDFAFFPSGHTHSLTAQARSRVLVIEKPFVRLNPALASERDSSLPEFLQGREDDVPSTALDGDDGLGVRTLLPASLAFDFAVNTMTYVPGASLPQVEVHYMEHGLLMLEGGGVYRLGEDWHSVTAGDAIWMAPFCPQWFAAIGKTPAKYIIYKDLNRHVLA